MISTTIWSRPLLAWAGTKCMYRPFSSLNNILRAEGASQRPPTAASPSVRIQQALTRAAGEYQLPLLRRKQTERHQIAQRFLEKANSIKGKVANEKIIRATMEDLQKDGEARALEKFQTRKWRQGDVYAPHDLTPAEMYKWKTRGRPTMDAFDALAINPMHEYKNFSIMSEYMTSMGRIRHSKDTGLRRVNQRRVSKAIRRAIGIGLMPSIHQHPEMLEMESRSRHRSVSRF